VAVDADVAQDEHVLVGDADALGRILDQQGAVQPEAHLRRRHHVGVIPEQARVGDGEVVGERSARLDFPLRRAGHAIHRDGNSEAVPVHGRRLRQRVLEMDDESIADAHAN